ncbi:MAG: hypothetical protein DMG40_18350 [Acidobacteria bacterium]|nr:MAG: hypothetical protein DMG40_18350 [Acidobacteriota bacterium]
MGATLEKKPKKSFMTIPLFRVIFWMETRRLLPVKPLLVAKFSLGTLAFRVVFLFATAVLSGAWLLPREGPNAGRCKSSPRKLTSRLRRTQLCR